MNIGETKLKLGNQVLGRACGALLAGGRAPPDSVGGGPQAAFFPILPLAKMKDAFFSYFSIADL